MNIYIFGNGNISFPDFKKHYEQIIQPYLDDDAISFSVGDFRGADTLAMELLKCATPNVTVYHVGDKPRYLPDKFNTQVGHWTILGGFKNDAERDMAAIENCTHFIAIDFNSDSQRKSGTLKNIEVCRELGKGELKMEN